VEHRTLSLSSYKVSWSQLQDFLHLYLTLLLSELALPPQPSGVQYNVSSRGTCDVAGDIEWNSSTDSSVDNFTITVSSLDGSTVLMTTVESSPLSNVILNYNTHYTISIRGRNCAGSSEPAEIQYMECECQDSLIAP